MIIKFKDLGIINPNSEVLKTNNNNTVNFRTANTILRNSQIKTDLQIPTSEKKEQKIHPMILFRMARNANCTFAVKDDLTNVSGSTIIGFSRVGIKLQWISMKPNLHYGVFHVFHVNRSVNIFLLNRKIFYVTKIC